MKTTKTIKITGQEILEYYVSVAEDCTIVEARDILKNAEIEYDIKEVANFDTGTYTRTLKEVEISYEN